MGCGIIQQLDFRNIADHLDIDVKKKFNDILESYPNAIVIIDALDLHIVGVNQAAKSLICSEDQELLNRQCCNFICANEKETCPMNDSTVDLEHSEQIIITTSGEKKSVLKSVKKIFIKDHPYYIESILNFADTQDTYQELLIKAKAISSSINAIVIADIAGNIIYVNPSFIKMWGMENEGEIIGKHIISLMKQKGKYMNIIDSITVGEGWFGELTAQKKDGEEIITQLSATALKNKEGIPIRFMASFVDITEQKHAEEKLKKSLKKIDEQNVRLRKLDQLKSSFLNITSHELRTPMSSVKGYIQMMLRDTFGSINEEQSKALDVVLRNVERLDRLIEDILDISRLESGTLKFIVQKTVISEMITEVEETMSSNASVKNISLNTDVIDNLPDLIIDQDRIKQVIINLVNNAIKFSPEGSEIRINVNKDDEHVLFEVKDLGRGIPEDKQKKIFETFYQVDSGMDRKFGGAGLGLSISRGIVMAHGGSIWVESTGVEGEGSSFKFCLPVKSIEDIEDRFKGLDVFHIK